jgi:hypothetical protein
LMHDVPPKACPWQGLAATRCEEFNEDDRRIQLRRLYSILNRETPAAGPAL